jgi:hypothetical protein
MSTNAGTDYRHVSGKNKENGDAGAGLLDLPLWIVY